MPNSDATGRCLCGRISYRVTGKTIWSGYCHCESCRRFSGAAVTSWLGIADDDLEFDGELLSHAFLDVDGDQKSELVVCVRRSTGERELRIHATDSSRVEPQPTTRVSILGDILAWCVAEVRGAEFGVRRVIPHFKVDRTLFFQKRPGRSPFSQPVHRLCFCAAASF